MDKYIDYYNDSKKVTYHEQTDISNILKLRAVLKTLPDFCKDYFRAMDPLTTTKTRISYAYDIRIFFQFLLDENPAFKDYSMKDFTGQWMCGSFTEGTCIGFGQSDQI